MLPQLFPIYTFRAQSAWEVGNARARIVILGYVRNAVERAMINVIYVMVQGIVNTVMALEFDLHLTITLNFAVGVTPPGIANFVMARVIKVSIPITNALNAEELVSVRHAKGQIDAIFAVGMGIAQTKTLASTF